MHITDRRSLLKGMTLGAGGAVKTPAASYGDPVAHKKRPHEGRTINALWTTLLHAAGQPVDGFNLNHAPVGIDKPGPMEELLV